MEIRGLCCTKTELDRDSCRMSQENVESDLRNKFGSFLCANVPLSKNCRFNSYVYLGIRVGLTLRLKMLWIFLVSRRGIWLNIHHLQEISPETKLRVIAADEVCSAISSVYKLSNEFTSRYNHLFTVCRLYSVCVYLLVPV